MVEGHESAWVVWCSSEREFLSLFLWFLLFRETGSLYSQGSAHDDGSSPSIKPRLWPYRVVSGKLNSGCYICLWRVLLPLHLLVQSSASISVITALVFCRYLHKACRLRCPLIRKRRLLVHTALHTVAQPLERTRSGWKRVSVLLLSCVPMLDAIAHKAYGVMRIRFAAFPHMF